MHIQRHFDVGQKNGRIRPQCLQFRKEAHIDQGQEDAIDVVGLRGVFLVDAVHHSPS